MEKGNGCFINKDWGDDDDDGDDDNNDYDDNDYDDHHCYIVHHFLLI